MAKAKNVDQLEKELSAILNESKEAFLRMFAEDVMGIVSVVGSVDVNDKPTGGERYIMRGFGCSVSWLVGKGQKGKKYARAAGAAQMQFKRSIEPVLKKLYPKEKYIAAIVAQDITVNQFLQHQASNWFTKNNVIVRSETRLD